MKYKIISTGLLLSFLLTACGSQQGGSSNVPESQDTSIASSQESSLEASSSQETVIPVTSVSLNKATLEIYQDDVSATLEATILPENATNQEVTWSSSNTAVATVNNGSITPLKAGKTTITVTTVDGNKQASCSLTVKEVVTIPNYVLHGKFQGSSDWTDQPMVNNPYSTSEYMIQGVALNEGDLFKVHMYGETWYGYSAVKTSTASGLVTAGPSDDNIKVLKTGVYDIYSDYNESDRGHIYIGKVGGDDPTPGEVHVTDITLNRTGKFMVTRNEFKLEATVAPSNATNKEVTWSSSDTSIATVTTAGRVVAGSKRGSTIITAKTVDGNKTATCLIYVSPSAIPDYYLTGTISGYSRGHGNYNFPAIPLSTNKYVIPDVELVAGDEIHVTGSNGATLKDKYNKTYTYEVSKNMSVIIYLDINDSNKNYLTFKERGNIAIPK